MVSPAATPPARPRGDDTQARERSRARDAAAGGVAQAADALVELSERMWDHPETAFEEERAATWTADLLSVAGFDVATGVGDLPTAYAATFGQGDLTVTICAADLDDGSGTGHCDGGVTVEDLLYFLDQFEQGTLVADLDDGSSTGLPDGGVTIDDLLYFLVRFVAGC